MATERQVSLRLQGSHDIVRMRHLVREQAMALGFSLVDQTKIVTAASELGRNLVLHGGGGEVLIEPLARGVRGGLRLTFVDHGPGIADIDVAMQDGYTTGDGLGLGLGGAKRLVNEFSIQSRPGEGTRVTIVRWR